VFAADGFLFSSWVARIPAVQRQLGASEPELGLALLVLTLGLVATMPWAPSVIGLVRGRATALGATVACTGFVLATLAPTTPALAVFLLVVGGGFGVWDVAMNAAAHEAEQRFGRTMMPTCHGAFSIGALSGAAVGSIATAGGVPAPVHLATVGVALLVALWTAGGDLPFAEHAGHAGRHAQGVRATRERRRGGLSGPLVPIAAVMACGAVSEGAAADWVGLYLRDRIGTSDAVAAVGYVLFSSAMAGGRFAGVSVLGRLGRARALQASGVLTATGIALLVVAPSGPAAFAAVGLWGLGAALVFPTGMTAAAESSRRPAEAIAAVSTAGYGGFLVGPALVGLLAGALGLGGALLVVSALGLGIAALAPIAGRRAEEAASSCSGVASGCWPTSSVPEMGDNPGRSAAGGCDNLVGQLGAAHQQVGQVGVRSVVGQRRPVEP
jgi:MFS family permease